MLRGRMDAVDDLVAIVARLRGEGGCPWDRVQTREEFCRFVLEEASVVVSAIDCGDRAALCREAGDAVFQIVLLARIAEEERALTLDDVARDASDKMVRRHPHVFDPG